MDAMVRMGVALASQLTKALQAEVMHYAWTGQDGFGVDTFAAGVPLPALVDRTVHERYTMTGKLVQTSAQLTFLDPIMPNGAAGRVGPIDPRDELILDDGFTAPIVEISGFEDAGMRRSFLAVVTLGKVLS